jgi:hypothetical protein
MQGNEASVRVLRKVGFEEEGTLRAYGYWKGRYHERLEADRSTKGASGLVELVDSQFGEPMAEVATYCAVIR